MQGEVCVHDVGMGQWSRAGLARDGSGRLFVDFLGGH